MTEEVLQKVREGQFIVFYKQVVSNFIKQGNIVGRANKELTRNFVSTYIFQLQDKATLLTAERKKVSHVVIALYQ